MAQFMYSSRLPTKLNQVHANVAFLADGKFDGIGTSKLRPIGQPPMMLAMTANVLPWSYETLNWQEPPPWTAVPSSVTEKFFPACRVVTEFNVEYALGVL